MATGATSVRATLRQLEALPPAAVTELVAWFGPRSKQVGGRMLWFGKRRQLSAKPQRRKRGQSSDTVVLVGVPVSCWSIKTYGRAGGYPVKPRRAQALSLKAYAPGAYFAHVVVRTSTSGDGRWDRLVAEADVQFPGMVEDLIERAVALMAGKEIKVTVKSEYDDKAANEALADVDKLDRADPEIEVSADMSNVLRALDQVAAETKDVIAAADALGRALGPELAAKADTRAIVTDLQRAGLTLEEITADADRLGAKLREVSDIDVGGRLGRNLGTARGQLDDMGRSADSSRSVLANMVGNATQDVGALGGVAGSAGVAIGQMGEYMADAANSGERFTSILGNFATVAGPIAGIVIALKTLTDIQDRFRQQQQRAADAQERWTDALKEGGDVAENYAEQLAEIGELTLDLTREQSGLENVLGEVTDKWYLGGAGVGALGRALGVLDDETKDLVDTFDKGGITAGQFADAVTGSADDQQRFIDAVHNTTLSAEEQADVIALLRQEVDALADAQERYAAFSAVFNPGNSGTVFDALRSPQVMAGRVAGIVNNIYNPPGTPAATADQLGTFLTRNSARTES